MRIEVAFKTPQLEKVIELELSSPLNLKEAILKSGISHYFPEYDLINMPVGVFGKRIYEPDNYVLKDGDRIEIYRPLTKSPNQKRLDRARQR